MPKVIVFDNYVLNSCKEKTEKYEVWDGRNRKSNLPISIYLFLEKLDKNREEKIRKWIVLCSYESSAKYLVRYVELICATYKTKDTQALVVRKISGANIRESVWNTSEQLRHFNNLVCAFCFIHGCGNYHGNLNVSSIIKDCMTDQVKVWKDPLNLTENTKEEEYMNCGVILKELFGTFTTNRYYSYLNTIVMCYIEPDPSKRIKKASPKNIHSIINEATSSIKKNLKESKNINAKMVELISVFKEFNIELPCPVDNKNLVEKLKSVCPFIPTNTLESKSRQQLKVIASLIKMTTPLISDDFLINTFIGHSLLAYAYIRSNTSKMIEFIKSHTQSKRKTFLNALAKMCKGEGVGLTVRLEIFEEYRLFNREIYYKNGANNDIKTLHNFIIELIVIVDEWFYSDRGINHKDILL